MFGNSGGKSDALEGSDYEILEVTGSVSQIHEAHDVPDCLQACRGCLPYIYTRAHMEPCKNEGSLYGSYVEDYCNFRGRPFRKRPYLGNWITRYHIQLFSATSGSSSVTLSPKPQPKP